MEVRKTQRGEQSLETLPVFHSLEQRCKIAQSNSSDTLSRLMSVKHLQCHRSAGSEDRAS